MTGLSRSTHPLAAFIAVCCCPQRFQCCGARHNGYPSGSQTADRLRIYLASVYTNRPHRPQVGQCGLFSSLCVNPMFYPMSASGLRRPESWRLWQTKHYRTRGTQACSPFPAAAPCASAVFSCHSFPAGSRPAPVDVRIAPYPIPLHRKAYETY